MLNQGECFSDSVRHAEGGMVVPVGSTDWKVARSLRTQRAYFVCNCFLAGARPTDNLAKTAYKLNAAGLPEAAYIQNAYDANLTLTAVNNGTVEDIETVMYMNYDESGGRIWTRVQTAEMDLVAGGYRNLSNGKAYFPVTDAQGNVRGYANDIGLVSAYDYYAYGGVERIVVDATDDNKKWQGKEYDEATGKLYFGARYYDPFFGMWLSPDPALVFFREVYAPLKWRDFIEKDILQRSNGEAVLLKHSFRASAQFANPYSYGGDPMNYVDLYGLWSIGFGFTVGWENGGFTAGVGAALDIGSKDFGVNLNFGASHNFKDRSNTFSAVAGASVNIGIVGVGANLGYSYNTLSGSSLNYGLRGSICGAGIGVNGANYWNTSGSYMGGTIGLEGFYGAFGAEAYAGYEWGYSGMNGREWYRGVRAFGFHAEYAQDGGWNYGGNFQAYLAYGNNTGKKGADGTTGSLVSAELWLPTLGKHGHFAFGETYDVSNKGIAKAQREVIKKELGEAIFRLYEAEKNLTKKAVILNDAMIAAGFKTVNRISWLHEGDKTTYAKDGLWGNYGNIEIITEYSKNAKPVNIYSSFNYGNHYWTHAFIDVVGYYAQNY